MVDKTDMVVKALELAEQGFAVFPLAPKSKVPPAGTHGFKDASKDPDVIRKAFSAKRNYNLGIATGPASGVWVLDVEWDGLADLARLEREHAELPITVSAKTGGGGRHLFFECNGAPVTNGAGLGGLAIDVRGDGGYVVSPPSIHDKSGEEYEWEHAPGTVPIAAAPQWVIDFVSDNGNSTRWRWADSHVR